MELTFADIQNTFDNYDRIETKIEKISKQYLFAIYEEKTDFIEIKSMWIIENTSDIRVKLFFETDSHPYTWHEFVIPINAILHKEIKKDWIKIQKENYIIAKKQKEEEKEKKEYQHYLELKEKWKNFKGYN